MQLEVICLKITTDPAKYGERTIFLERDDGIAGNIQITGSEAMERMSLGDFKENSYYRITIEELPQD